MGSSPLKVRQMIGGVLFFMKISSLDTELGRSESYQETEKMYVAIYDYDARTDEDLTFRDGDLLLIIDDRLDHLVFFLKRKSIWCFSQSD